MLTLLLGADASPRFFCLSAAGSSPASPTHRAVWGSIFHPGSNSNMPRGRSRYDTVEPGSPSTWDHVLRSERHVRTSNGGNSGASTPRTSMDGPAAASSPKIVDVGKLDALMQARFKQSNGKLSYHGAYTLRLSRHACA
jgi:hypothetical protein